MGVGFAADLVVCCALGVDMFDCVFPTRTAVRMNAEQLFELHYDITADSKGTDYVCYLYLY
jgi:tRNA-guanine family transglycosylase